MRRVIALITVVLVPILGAACGGSTPSAHSHPPASVAPPRLHLGAGSGSVGSASLAPAIYPTRTAKYVLDGPLADLGASATVRRLVPHEVTDADVRRIASALGVDPAAVTISTAGGTTNVSYGFGSPQAVGGSSGSSGASGPPAISTPPASTSTTTAPQDVPAAAAAEQIARSLLDRMGVLGTDQWTTNVADSGGVVVSCPAGVPCPTVPPTLVSSRTVTFDRVVEGTTVQSAGWSVTIGSHGRIESLSGQWASLADAGSYPLRSTRAVFADLRAGKARSVGPQPMTAAGAPAIVSPGPSPVTTPFVVHITGVSLGYATWFAYDGTTAHTDIVPTYRFRARADGSTSYDVEVLALDPSAFDIVNPAPVPTSPPKVTPEPAPAPGGVPSGGASTATGSSPGR